jgi:hypothetical protein
VVEEETWVDEGSDVRVVIDVETAVDVTSAAEDTIAE